MKATARRLRALCDLVIGVYGPANRTAFSFMKALEAIDRARTRSGDTSRCRISPDIHPTISIL